MGFVYSSLYYNEFGISYLNHAETSDLFFVIFVHPWFLLSLLWFVSSFFVFRSINETKDKNITLKYERIWGVGKLYKYRLIILSFIVFLGVIYRSYSVVLDKIEKIRSLNLPIHQITYNKNNILKCVVNIGSTSANLFYWDVTSSKAVIIPKKQVVKIAVIMPNPPFELNNGATGRRAKPLQGSDKTEYEKSLLLWGQLIKDECK
ncbi:MAG: hypothetical protein ACSHW0_19310 [Thalassotalea sp.]